MAHRPGNRHQRLTDGQDTWRARCGESRTAGSASGPGKRTDRKASTAPRSDLATHKTPAIKAWLARHPRFHIHFTPTGSSWINQVERWFSYLTTDLLQRGVYKNVQALEKDIRQWIQSWNADPKPFVWKKTAEEILNSLSRYISRISGAGH
jgi:transposase